MRRATLVLVVVLAAAGTLEIGPAISRAEAATLVVNSAIDGVDAAPGDGRCRTADRTCTLRAAVQEANAAPGPDVIQLTATTYTLSIYESGAGVAAGGDLDVVSDLTIEGAAMGTTTVTGGPVWGDRILEVHSAATATVRNVRITHGTLLDEVAGGAIRNRGTLTLEGGVVSNNSAGEFGSGGGIANEGTLVLDRMSVYANNGGISGGGLWNTGTATVRNTMIASNSAGVSYECGYRTQGGGIANYGRLNLSRSRITQNYAAFLGGGLLNTGNVLVEQTTVDGNYATQGAGIFNNRSGDLSMVNVTVSGNRAQTVPHAGGNCDFDANSAHGGGLLSIGRAGLSNVTLAFNESPSGGRNLETWHRTLGTGSMSVVNTIVGPLADRSCSVDPRNPAGQLLSIGSNIDSGDLCLFHSPGDRVRTDAALRPLKSNGGPAPTHALAEGSPAIDRGIAWACTSSDGRGYVRPVDGDRDGIARCDIGAYEAGVQPGLITPPPLLPPLVPTITPTL